MLYTVVATFVSIATGATVHTAQIGRFKGIDRCNLVMTEIVVPALMQELDPKDGLRVDLECKLRGDYPA